VPAQRKATTPVVEEHAPRERKGTAERRERRRVEILDAAARLFAERGYDATSIDDLVAATGLQRGGLYHYMDSKQDLLVQIHARFVEPQVEEVRGIVAAGEPADVTLRLVTHALMRSVAAYRDQGYVFMHERQPMLDHPEWPNVRRLRREFENLVGSVFERGMADGVFEKADVRLTVLAYLGMVNATYEWFRADGRFSPEAVAERFADIFLTGAVATP
jgi:AcrR family transcriptional regulator